MGVRENKVERYLDDEVKKLGGVTRKWVSPGRDGVPDRIVVIASMVVFVEVKTDDGKLSPMQVREHDRLRAAGAEVWTVYGEQGVDDFIDTLARRVG